MDYHFAPISKTAPKVNFVIFFMLLMLVEFIFGHPAEARTSVKVGVYNNKPLVFLDNSQKPNGIFIDLLEFVAAEEQWELIYVPGSWSDCMDRLDSGEIDLLTAIAYSPERAQKYNFTYETVITNWGQVFVPKGSEITSVLDLKAKKIAVKMDDIHFQRIRELTNRFGIQSRFIEADQYDTVMELIHIKKVQAAVVNRLYGIQHKNRYLVEETPIMFNPIEVRFASPKNTGFEYLSAIDIHLRRLKAQKDSYFTRSLNNWLMAPAKWAFPNSAKYALLGALFILVLFAVLTLTLRIQVRNRTQALSSANAKLKEQIVIREKAQDELRMYERIMAASADHMAMIDPSYSIQAINDAALDAVGKTREEVVGKKVWDIFGNLFMQNRHKKRLDRAFSGQIAKYKTWINFPVLGRRYLDVVYSPYIQSDGKRVGCVVNSRDITEQHELELKLEQAQKMEFMGTIAGGVAHDLNNILSGIVSYPDLLLMQLPEDSPLTESIETIKSSGQKAAVIVQDLLTLARRGVANKKPVNLNDIVTAFLKSPECSKIVSFHSNVRITLDLRKEINSISGSSVHLSKTLMNLVSNAAEAMPNGGELNIATRQVYLEGPTIGDHEIVAGNYILLEITDNGNGISPDDLKRIFEPFYTKKVMGRSGTGLGLAVVWGTVMDHQGYIDVASDGGNGTTFQLYFPVSDGEVQTLSADLDMQQYRGNGESILIVDDDPKQRDIASAILAHLGYNASTISSGEEAIRVFENKRVDLVILDMLMPPGIDGLSTYKKIKEIQPGQKAIIASGFAETERVKEALSIGVGRYIKKPYTIDEIGRAVKEELNKTLNL